MLLLAAVLLAGGWTGSDAPSAPSAPRPSNVTVNGPMDQFRASASGSGLNNTLKVEYSYQESGTTDQVKIRLAVGTDTMAFYTRNDSDYAGDDSPTSKTLDLSNPDETANGGLVDGQSYDIIVLAVNESGNTAEGQAGDALTIDNTVPNAPGNVSATAVSGGGVEVTFDDVDESGSGVAEYAVKRRTGTDSFAAIDTVSDDGSGTYTFTDTGRSTGTTYDYVVTALDGVGNESSQSDAASTTADGTPPTIQQFTADNPDGTQDVEVAIETDEPLGGNEGDLEVNLERDGSAVTTLRRSDFAESGSYTYTGTYSGSSDGTYTATLAAARDTVGNDGGDGETAETVVDTQGPASLTIDGPPSTQVRASDPSNGGRDTLSVTYSYVDLSPDTTTITVTDGSNSATFGVNDDGYAADGSGKTVTLDLSETPSSLPEGTYDIEVTATDTVGQSNPNPTTASGRLELDNTPPTITSVDPPSPGTYGIGDSFSFTTNFDETVFVDPDGGTPALELTVDETSPDDALYDGGDGSSALTFEYTVDAGDDTLVVATSSVQLDGGTLRDAAGNRAELGFTAPDLAGVSVDGVPPSIGGLDLTNAGDNNVDFKFETTEPVPAIEISVEGPNGATYTFTEADFSETAVTTNGFDFRYDLTATQAYDDGGGVYTATVDVAVDTAGNDGANGDEATYELPRVQDDNLSTDEDTQISADAPGVLDNDSPADATVTSVEGSSDNTGTRITLDSGAELTLNTDGSYVYNPNESFEGLDGEESDTDAFTYTISANSGTSSPATVTVDIDGVNDPPNLTTNSTLALDNTGNTKTIGASNLSASDPDDGPASLTYTVTSGPENGQILVGGSEANSFTQQALANDDVAYAHDGTNTSRDSIVFDLDDDEAGGAITDTFNVVIGLDNQLPTATDDNASTTEDQTIEVTKRAEGVLGNDDDPDGNNLNLEVISVQNAAGNVGSPVQLGGGGVITINPDGTYTFNPNGDFQDLDQGESRSQSIPYTVADGDGGTATAFLNVTVNGENDAPSLPVNDGLTVRIGGSATLTTSALSATDVDDTPSELTFTLTAAPQNGTLLKSGQPLGGSFTQSDLENGVLEYRHGGSDSASDSFTFDLTDDSGAGPTGVTFSITIQRGTPTARNDTFSVDEDQTLSVAQADNGVLANDSDPEADDLTASLRQTPADGALSFDADGTFEYTPDADFDGTDTFVYAAEDPNGNRDEATVVIEVAPINDPPRVATNNGITVDESGTETISTSELSAADVDDGASSLTFTVTDGPSQGQIEVNGNETGSFTQQNLNNGEVRYNHTASTADNDSFVFDLSDDDGGTVSGRTFSISVSQVNGSPVARDDRYLANQGRTFEVADPADGVLANDDDPDGDDLEAVVTDSTTDGTVSLDATAGTFRYTPSAGFNGGDSFQYEVRDGRGGTARATVTLQVRPARAGVSVTRSFPDPTQQRSFRLVALPGTGGPSLASTVSGARGDDWRAFREQGTTDTTAYSRAPCGGGASCPLDAGAGYWLIARDAWSVEDSLQTVALEPDTAADTPVYRLPLQDGWNAISNPLETDVAWGAVQAASGTNQPIYRWDGGWTEASTFASAADGEAYYFRDDALDTLVVPYPSLGPSESEAETESRSEKRADAGPTLALHAVRDGDTLSTVRAGRRAGAEAALDSTDRYAPPAYFGTTSLRLVQSGEERTHALRADYRPPGSEGHAFDVRLRAAPDTAITLAARGLSSFRDDRVVLVNRAQGRSHDLRADSSVTLVPSSGPTRFRLLVGSAAFVEEAQSELAPDETKLLPNYPNPFRRATTIEYALEERQEVRIAIYDVLGRRVEVLVDGPKRAGFHRLQWQGRGRDGRPVASGVYFARLVAGSTTRTERLVVVR